MSAIPDNYDFRQLIDSLTVSIDPGGIKIRDEITGQLSNGGLTVFPALYLHFYETGKIGISVLIRKFCESWQGTEHPSSTRLAELAIAVFTVLKSGYPDSLAFFNQLLKSTVDVDVSHFALFPVKSEEGKPAEFSGFRFGAVRDLALEYRSTRANSNYYQLHGGSLGQNLGLESPIYKRAVVSFLDPAWQSPSPSVAMDSRFREVLLCYYYQLSLIYFERMWQDLDDKQSIGVAGGIEAFNVPSLKTALGLASVTIYLNQTKHRWDGYVVPYQKSEYIINSWTGYPDILQNLESFQAGLKFPLSPTLSQVARYGVRARRAASNSDWSEALLSFTIALEMLFSEKNQTSQAVSRRFAVAISGSTPLLFADYRKEILSLYDARSKYVHAGITPNQKSVESMTCLFEKALSVLIRLEKMCVLSDEQSFNDWIKILDWIATGYEASQVPTARILEEAGLIEASSTSNPQEA
jgi:hypothetical protein